MPAVGHCSGCGKAIARTKGSAPRGQQRCQECRRRQSGANQQHGWSSSRVPAKRRGYGQRHKELRESWRLRIAGGELVPCARCQKPIGTRDAWDLDHTDDRSGYLGPSHRKCNLSAASAKARARQVARKGRRPQLQQDDDFPLGTPSQVWGGEVPYNARLTERLLATVPDDERHEVRDRWIAERSRRRLHTEVAP
jgi:hypothetical protein